MNLIYWPSSPSRCSTNQHRLATYVTVTCSTKVWGPGTLTNTQWSCKYSFLQILISESAIWGKVFRWYWIQNQIDFLFFPIFFANFRGASCTRVRPIHRCIRYFFYSSSMVFQFLAPFWIWYYSREVRYFGPVCSFYSPYI